MVISINVKSGTGGYYDEDNCDLNLKHIEDDGFPIPRIGETIEISEENDKKRTNAEGKVLEEYHDYLVTDVKYWLNNNKYGCNAYGVTVYVVPIGRCIN